MTQAIQQHKELLTRALNSLEEIERRESLYKAAVIPSLKESYKTLLEISQIRYAQTMAAIHCLITPLSENESTQTDAELLQNVDEFMQQLTINATANGLIEPAQSKEGFIQDAKMFFEAENR